MDNSPTWINEKILSPKKFMSDCRNLLKSDFSHIDLCKCRFLNLDLDKLVSRFKAKASLFLFKLPEICKAHLVPVDNNH